MKSDFSKEEKAAMKERAKELKAAAKKVDGEKDLLSKIDAMPEPDQSIARRIHEIVRENAPMLAPKTWYGMPAYANAEGKVVLFFRDTQKFAERYMTLGFNEEARLDDGEMWPIVFALKSLTKEGEQTVASLVRKAVGKA